MTDIPDQLLNALPPQALAFFGFAFALAFLVSKIFDVVLKWKKVKGSPQQIVVTEAKADRSYMENTALTRNQLIGYAFLGAMILPVLVFIAYLILIRVPAVVESQFYNLLVQSVFSLFAAFIVVFFLSKKFDLLNYNKVVVLLTAFAVKAVISMPVSVFMFAYNVNKFSQ